MGRLKKILILTALPLVLLALGLVSMLLYQGTVIKRAKNEAYTVLADSQRDQINTLTARLDGLYALLHTFADAYTWNGQTDDAGIIDRMGMLENSSDFNNIFFAYNDGRAINDEGTEFDVGERYFFLRNMAGEPSIEKVSKGKLTGEPMFILSIPVMLYGKVIGVAGGTYSESTFRSLIETNAYGGESYSVIINSSGNTVIGSNALNYLSRCDNFLDAIKDSEFNDNSSYELLAYDFSTGKSNVASITLEGRIWYISYQPTEINDWVSVNMVSAEAVETGLGEMFFSGYINIGIVSAVSMAIVIITLVFAFKQASYAEREEDYKRQLSLYRTSDTGGVFSVALDRDLTLLYGNDKYYAIHEYTPKKMRERLENKCSAYIYPEDIDRVREKLSEAAQTDGQTVSGVIRIITGSGKIKYILTGGIIKRDAHGSVLNGTVVDISEQKRIELALKENEEALRVGEEIYRTAVEISEMNIWEYDIATKRIFQSEHSQRMNGYGHVITDAPRTLIEEGYVHPDDVDNYAVMFSEMNKGLETGGGIFRVRRPDGSGYWYEQVRYKVIRDADGLPLKAIGTTLDVTERVEVLNKYTSEVRLRHAMTQDLCASAIINLDHGAIEVFDTQEGGLASAGSGTPEELFTAITASMCGGERVRRSILALDCRSLISAYENGQTSIDFELRRKPDENVLWFALELRMTEKPDTSERLAFVYLRNIDSRHRELEALQLRAETDPLTGVANVTTAREKINNRIKSAGEKQLSALFMLDLDNFKGINDTMGHSEGDRVLKRITGELRRQFNENDIIARVGGDEFIVFLSDIPSPSYAADKAGRLCEALQYSYTFAESTVDISCSIGVALSEGAKNDYDALFREADTALYRAKQNGKDQFAFAHTGELAEVNENDIIEQANRIIREDRNKTVQLSALLEHMDGGILLITVGEQITTLYVSPSFRSTMKYSEGDTADNAGFIAMICEDDRASVVSDLRRGVADRTVIDSAFRVVTPDGITEWRHMRAARIEYEGVSDPVLIAVITDITALKRLEADLTNDRRKLSLAFEQTGLIVWEYDRADRSITVENDGTVYENLPQAHIENGMTHSGSKDDYIDFFRRMNSDERSGYAIIKSRYASDDYMWYRFSFSNIFASDGSWLKTVGVTSGLPHIDAIVSRFEREDKLRVAAGPMVVATTKINLTRGIVESAIVRDLSEYTKRVFGSSKELFDTLAAKIGNSEEQKIFRDRFSTENLLSVFAGGRTWMSCEFRRVDPDGHIGWTSNTVYLIDDPVNGDVFCYGCIRSIDERKRYELASGVTPHYDPAAILYDELTERRIVESTLKRHSHAASENCAMIALRLRGLDHVQIDRGFASYYDSVFMFGRLAALFFGGRYITGVKDEETIVFIPSVADTNEAAELLDGFLEFIAPLRGDSSISEELIIEAGVVVAHRVDVTYDALVFASATALDSCGEAEYGRFHVRSIRDMTAGMTSVYIAEDAENAAVSFDDNAEKTLYNFMEALLLSRSRKSVMPHLLQDIGEYYGATRVFTLSLSSSDNISLSDEWSDDNAVPIGETLTNVPINSFPAVNRTLAEERVTILSGDGDRPWSYITAPMTEGGRIRAFICVEAPTKHQSDTALLSRIVMILQNNGKNLPVTAAEQSYDHIDSGTGLYNRAKYEECVTALETTPLSSLGVFYTDMNSLANVNNTMGSRYGDDMIMKTGKVFASVFDRESVFRLSGDEFVVLCQDITQEVFGNKCAEVLAKCKEEYKYGVSGGYTWSDADISAVKMIEHAQKLMKIEKQNYYETCMDEGLMERPELLDNLLCDIAQGRYIMYLQPKYSVREQKITAAEALVRYLDKDGNIITPSHFLPLLESRNIIRHVDYSILEQAMKTLREWRESGQTVLPIAVNFSRYTLLDVRSPEIVTALMKKYGVTTDDFELEITESVGSIEKPTVALACRHFTDMGIKFVLDDYGSEYSSLSMIPAINFSVIKLDKSLIDDIVISEVNSALVGSTIDLCRRLGITTVAEGVETARQLEELAKLDCDLIQGYFIGRPVSREVFDETYIKQLND